MGKLSGSLVAMSGQPSQKDSSRPSRSQPRGASAKRDSSQLLLVGLIVLALVASLAMLFTGSLNLLKLAMLAALWAAAIGVFLVMRYRNELTAQQELHSAEIEQIKVRFDADQATRELEMERIAAQQAQETTNEALQEIKSQLDDVKNQLEELSGYAIIEPTMIRAEARRILELEGEEGLLRNFGTDSISDFLLRDDDAGFSPHGHDAVTAEFTEVDSNDSVGSAQSSYSSTSFDSGFSSSTTSASWKFDDPTTSSSSDDSTSEPKVESNLPPTTTPGDPLGTSRGRRRRDEHSSGLSVADLLKRKDT